MTLEETGALQTLLTSVRGAGKFSEGLANLHAGRMREGVGREDGAKREGTAARAKLGAWHSDAWDPLPEPIEPMTPETARLRFLDLYFDLRGVR